jgi:hypothetical protein
MTFAFSLRPTIVRARPNAESLEDFNVLRQDLFRQEPESFAVKPGGGFQRSSTYRALSGVTLRASNLPDH